MDARRKSSAKALIGLLMLLFAALLARKAGWLSRARRRPEDPVWQTSEPPEASISSAAPLETNLDEELEHDPDLTSGVRQPVRVSTRRYGIAVGIAGLFTAGLMAAGALGGPDIVVDALSTLTGTTEETSTQGATETTTPVEAVPAEVAPTETVIPAGTPTIASDKADYAPGEAVTLLGQDWQPGESVHIFVNDDEGQSWSRNVDVTAAADGTFRDDFQLPNWFVATFSVKATGPESGTAATTFTDAVVGGIVSWEKRSQNGGGLLGGATFTLGGASGPFACSGNTTNPVTIVDNGPFDGAGGNGAFQVVNVCPGSYTVTETVAPNGHLLDPDPTRAVTVTSGTPNVTIGTQGSAQDCPDADPAIDGDTTSDFCNPALGSISWEKRNQTNGNFLNAATFTITGTTTGPFDCTGDATNPVTVVDDGPLDEDSTDGQFEVQDVCSGAYTVTETVAPNGFTPDPDPTRAVTVTNGSDEVIGTQGSAQDCPDAVPATDTDEVDFCNPAATVFSISWEKRSQASGNLQLGATFTVGGASGPFACSGNTTNPVTVVDNDSLDADGDNGQFTLSSVCPGTYTVTETVAPSGFLPDPDPTREVTVTSANETIGTQGNANSTCPDSVPATDTDEDDFCNPAATVFSISWEKRSQNGGGLIDNATFTVGGASGPFACSGNTTNPVTVVDNDSLDADGDNGQFTLSSVCPGTYTVTETVAPSGFLPDPDPTREVTVTSANETIGTQGNANSTCPDSVPATDTDEDDFCNPALGSIEWEKRNQTSGTGALLGGATFTVTGATTGPFDCMGDATNPVTVVDDGPLDEDSTDGQFELQDVCSGSYTVTETVAPNGFTPDPDATRAVTVTNGSDEVIGTQGNANSTCPDSVPATDTDEDDFCNPATTVFSISWEKRSQASGNLQLGATFTVGGASGPFACSGNTTNPVTVVDNDSLDADGDNGQFTLSSVCPGTYTVTETIAPGSHFLEPDPTREVTVTSANETIGTQGNANGTCPDAAPGTDTDEDDFCDPQVIVGSISWEKRKHSDGTLQGGATFTVGGTSGPFSCFGTATNPVTVVDNGTNDFSATAGVLVLENVCPGTYSVTETVAPSTFTVDPDSTRSVTVDATGSAEVIGTQGNANSTCPDSVPATDTDEDDFCNPVTSAFFNVSKNFSDKPSTDTTNVTVGLDCGGNGTVAVNDSTASEADAANFTVTGFTGDPTCTATESPIPTGYTGSGSPEGTCTAALVATGTCTITNTRETGTINVVKQIEPDTDPGLFDLQVNSTTEAADAADNEGTASPVTVNTGTNTVGEVAGTGTDLADYTSAIECTEDTNGASPVSSSDAGPLNVPVEDGDAWACTITNTRETGTINVVKQIEPDTDPGLFDLQVNSTTEAADAADNEGTASPVTVNTGTNTVGEVAGTGTDLADYTSAIECTEDTNGASPVSSSDAGPLNVPVEDGDAWACTITNTRETGTINVVKQIEPDTDPGLFDLQVNSTTEAADAADNEGTASPVTVNTGTNTVGEVAGTGTDLADYTSAIECTEDTNGASPVSSSDAGPLNVPVEDGDAWACTITNTRETGTINVVKQIEPDTDPGLFDLQVNSTTEAADAADNEGTASPVTVNTGTNTVGEVAGTGTDLADYTSAIECTEDTNGASPVSSSDAGPLNVPVEDGDAWACTITNTRETGTINVVKQIEPDTDPGLFDLQVNSTTEAADAADNEGTASPVTVNTGTNTVGEVAGTGTDLADYTSAIECTEDTNGASPVSSSDAGPLNVPVEDGDAWACTITNTRETGTINVVKQIEPDTDPGLFDLQVNSTTEAADAADNEGTASPVTVNTGTNTVGEVAGTGTDLADYTSAIECTEDTNGASPVSSSDAGPLNVPVEDGDAWACTITNTRETGTINVVKQIEPDTDPGLFDLQVNSTTEAADAADNEGTASPVTVNTGTNTVGEVAGTGTDLADYTSAIECTEDTNGASPVSSSDAGPLNVPVEDGDAWACTITNTRETGTINVVKQIEPDTDPGLFDLQVNSTTEAADAADNEGTASPVTVNTGTNTVGEVAGTGTDLADYTSAIECTEDTNGASPVSSSDAGPLNVPVEDGDAWACTITNTRETGTINVVKQIEPDTDPGLFDLQVNSTTEAADAADNEGTASPVTVNTGTNTVGEVAGTGTDLADYTSAIECTEDTNGASPVSSSDAGPLNVPVEDGDAWACTITNTRETGTINVVKQIEPDTDPGLFDLQVNSTTEAADAADNEGTASPVTVNTGTNTVGEVAGTGTDLADYTSAIECTEDTNGASPVSSSDAGPLNVPVEDGDAWACTITNTRETGTINVVKQIEPDTDPGLFDLQVNSTTEAADAADNEGTASPVTVNTGTNTVGEVAGTGTDLADYTSAIECTEDTNGASPVSSSDAGPLNVPVEDGDAWACTITNTRETGTINVVKQIEPDTDPGLFDLQVNSTTEAADAADNEGTASPVTVNTGTNTVGEVAGTGTDLADYTSAIECTEDTNGASPVSSSDAGPLNVPVEDGDAWECTITNTREAGQITITKDIVPDSAPGLFDLRIGNVIYADDVGDGGTTGAVSVPTGSQQVNEVPGAGMSVTVFANDYDHDTTCTEDTNSASPVTGGSSVSVPVEEGDDWQCTIVNTYLYGTITITKDIVPDSAPGLFDLRIGSVTYADDVGDGGTTGPVTIPIGDRQVNEVPGAGMSVTEFANDYDHDTTCTEDTSSASPVTGGSSVSVPVEPGDDWQCTIVNTYLNGAITITKELVPDTDPGLFDLKISGTTFADDAGDGGTTGPIVVPSGNKTVSESAGTGTDLAEYTTNIDCIEDPADGTNAASPLSTSGSGPLTVPIEAGANDSWDCTITNTRQSGQITITKELDPDTDPGLFDLELDGNVEEADASDGDSTGPLTVLTGNHDVSESAGSVGSLSDYDVGINCTEDTNGASPLSSLTSSLDDIPVEQGDAWECTITNTRQTGQIVITKLLNPTDDPGLFDLELDGIVKANEAGHTGSTGVLTVGSGNHNVSESADGETSLTNYTQFISCGESPDGGTNPASPVNGTDAGPLTVPIEQGDFWSCGITNTRKIGTIVVTKDLEPNADAGLFDLQIDAVTDPDANDIGDGGSTGGEVVNTGSHTVGEVAGTSTSLNDYTSSITCVEGDGGGTNAASPVNVSSGGPATLPVEENDLWQCTITNTRKQTETTTIELRKIWVGTPGNITLRIGKTSGGAQVDSQNVVGVNGTTGPNTVVPGTYYLSERFNPPSQSQYYTTTFTCFNDLDNNGANNGEPAVSWNASIGVQVGNGDHVICIKTNTRREGTIELRKIWVGTPGNITLRIGKTSGGAQVDSQNVVGVNGTTGPNTVVPGTYYLSERFNPPSQSQYYTTTFTCFNDLDNNGANNGEPAVSWNASIGVQVGNGDHVICIKTNTRREGTIELRKIWVGTPGNITLRIGKTSGGAQVDSQNVVGVNGTTGPNTVVPGTYYLSERFNPPSQSQYYTTTFTCFNDLDNNGANNGEPAVSWNASIGVQVGNGDHVICIKTNTRK